MSDVSDPCALPSNAIVGQTRRNKKGPVGEASQRRRGGGEKDVT